MYEKIKIFEGMTSSEIASLCPIIRNYSKGIEIISEGSEVNYMGIVLSGSVEVFRTTYGGKHILILSGTEGFVFGESISILGFQSYPVSVKSLSDCSILLIKSDKLRKCTNGRFLMNMMKVMAETSIEYRQKITVLEQHSTREKILAFLTQQSRKYGSKSFDITFDRQGLADYLGVERSAMSSEIGKLVKEKKIFTKKNHFEIL